MNQLKPAITTIETEEVPSMHAMIKKLYFHQALLLVASSILVVQFTDISGAYDPAPLIWKIALCFSSISPWTITSLYKLIKKHSNDRIKKNNHIFQYRKLFMFHDLVHNFTAFFYHYINLSIFAWIGMMNFPFWFLHLDQVMSLKERMTSGKKNDDVGKDRSTSMGAYMVKNVKSHIMQEQTDPLLVLGIVVFGCGCICRGSSYLLSGSALVPLSFPFTRRKFNFAVTGLMVPMGVLFMLEHITIMYEMDTFHNAVHMVSHYYIHKMINDLYVHHVI